MWDGGSVGRNGQVLKKVFRESQQLRKIDAEGTLPIKTVGEIKAVLFAGIESCSHTLNQKRRLYDNRH